MSKLKSQFDRVDVFDSSVDYSDPIVRKWIHKQVVKKTGSTEDDFVVEEKPVLVEEINIQKSIDEESKTTDLKYLLKQILMTGDVSILNQRQGFYGDITGIQDIVEHGTAGFVSAESVKSQLPEELQSLTVEELARMSDENIAKYISQVRSKVEVDSDNSSDEKKEG